ncbi:cation-translocating P-type ATPase [Demequina zhanjiangensis]|uniref:Cation-transporting P-type ATPase n=1 Tax=Demequina zhanjiangensis TaxID=3051659 RepID=A0ABT8FZT9_9MICO|nr:cation-transporting P-type ATPase [Demequina sp. SYSU T00b26]MDN4472411.1 cation-transporting P-type ATPase [Demequina sp. SYSU T00b26]
MSEQDTASRTAWWTFTGDEALSRLGVTADGLSAEGAATRLVDHGPNELTAAKSASVWQLALRQLVDPMNLMLVGVCIVSAVIAETSTAIMIGLLVVANVWSGAAQERKAQASVDALATMQVPTVRVRRGGTVVEVPAVEIVPGDVIELEAGDIVPADARILRCSTLEAQEAALTGESAPVEKAADADLTDSTGLGDRVTMLYQNTSVTRGTGTAVVVETGMGTEMGAIATMLSTVERVQSPLQKELGSLTKVIGAVAWGAVAVIILLGLGRGDSFSDLMFLGTAVAISAIPTGLPTFVQGMLGWGSRQLSSAKAIVASLNDVETLGATSAICSDKTGTLTMNQMTARTVWIAGRTFTVDGAGYSFEGTIRSADGEPVEPGGPLAYALALPNDATVTADGTVVGDPTEAAFVVLAEKLGVDVPEAHRRFPREAEVPFDSDYKFMATFHHVEWQGQRRLLAAVKGAPDVLLKRSEEAVWGKHETVPAAQVTADVTQEIEYRSSQGLRTLALAVKVIDEKDEAAALADPMSAIEDLTFVSVVGIVDPLRPEAAQAVAEAYEAGITVRMITGDHAVTAAAIGRELGLEGEAVSGAELAAMDDATLDGRLAGLSVFGRVTPQDKLRLVQHLQSQGKVVAMTGDAVNDAAAIKQADIGVAMGSGSEVTKQAAKLVLTDDNFATLVRAVKLGRIVYGKITNYLTFQMAQLIALVVLFLAASVLNVNGGVALTPVMTLVLNFAVVLFPVIMIMTDPAPDGLMKRPPRDTSEGLASRAALIRWFLYGTALAIAAFLPLLVLDDLLASDGGASVPMTMAFVIVSFATVGTGVALRRDPESGLKGPWGAVGKLAPWPIIATVVATELPFLQSWLDTTSLSGGQWLAAIALSLAVVAVVEADKWWRRRGEPAASAPAHVTETVAPARAR